MGKTSSTLMIALAVLALFWGNCFSCPQMLSAKAAGHSCCPKTHQTTVKCESQGMQNFEKAEMHAPVALVATSSTVEVSTPVWTSMPEFVVTAPLDRSTPPLTLRV